MSKKEQYFGQGKQIVALILDIGTSEEIAFKTVSIGHVNEG